MNNKALSPFISFALVILVGITAISLALTVLNPAFNKARDSAIINEAINNLDLLDNNIKEVASESQDSRRKVNLKVTEGAYRVDGTNDFLNFTYRMKEGLDISGQRGSINITVSGDDITLFINYINLDLQGSAHFTKGDNTVIVLHNGTNQTTNYPIIYLGR